MNRDSYKDCRVMTYILTPALPLRLIWTCPVLKLEPSSEDSSLLVVYFAHPRPRVWLSSTYRVVDKGYKGYIGFREKGVYAAVIYPAVGHCSAVGHCLDILGLDTTGSL